MSKYPYLPVATVLMFWLGAALLWGSSHKKEPAGPDPEQRIPVAPLGYRPPGALYMLSGKSFSSLDFVDANHLLFTFHLPRLMRREANAGRFEEDQIIQALILSLPEGKVVTSTEWRMRDRARYLWPLGAGKFLVRQGNSYSLTDASLKLEPYIQVATPVQATEVSPDGTVLLIEHEYERHTPEEHRRLMAQAEEYGEPPPKEDTQITLVKVDTREVMAALRTAMPIEIPLTGTGYVGVVRDKNQDEFQIRFLPFEGQARVLGKVASTCTPHEDFLNQKALIIETCGPKSPDFYLDAWTIDGKKLWNGRREAHLVWPTYADTPANSRFAVSLLLVSHYIDLPDSLNEEDVRAQVVQVFDSATGTLLMTTTASPVLTAGQNFALSEDGEHLAVLHQGAIEIFKVPSPPAPPAAPPTAAAEKK